MTMLEPQTDGIPLPSPTPTSAPFWDACAEGRLLYQRCASCDAPIFNPALLCPVCRCRDLAWTEGAGRGAIYSWTIAYRPLSPSFTSPYAAIIVDLDEGYQMVSNLIGCEIADVAVGLRVRVDFRQIDEMTIPYFTPEGARVD